jgi:Flp pilus assembly protein TadD
MPGATFTFGKGKSRNIFAMVVKSPEKPRKFSIRRGLFALTVSAAMALTVGGCASTGKAPEFAQSAPFDAAADLPAHLRIAAATLAGGDAINAADLYRRAHELHPEAAAPLAGLGRALRQLAQNGDAMIAYTQALARDPAEKSALHGLGALHLAIGQGAGALVRYDALLKLDATDHRAWNGRGVALDMLARHAEAWRSYRAGLAVAPDNIALRNNYGLSLAMGGKTGDGIQILRKLASAPGATPRTRQNLALALGLAGDLDAAKQISALDLPPGEVAENAAFYEYIRARQPELEAETPAAEAGAE